MPIGRRKPVPEGKIEKPEDKVWKEEFEQMSVEDHKKALQQLGLDEEDIDEWEQTVGYKKKAYSDKKKADKEE